MLWTSLRKRSPARELIMKNESEVNPNSFFVVKIGLKYRFGCDIMISIM